MAVAIGWHAACAGVADEYCSLRDAVIWVELAAVDGMLVVEALAGRVDLN